MTSDPESYDTPTKRALITQMRVDELDAWLDRIREARLKQVKKLEAAAKVRSDQVRLEAFLKLERQVHVAERALAKLDEQVAKCEKLVHRARLLAMAAQLEVEEQDAAD